MSERIVPYLLVSVFLELIADGRLRCTWISVSCTASKIELWRWAAFYFTHECLMKGLFVLHCSAFTWASKTSLRSRWFLSKTTHLNSLRCFNFCPFFPQNLLVIFNCRCYWNLITFIFRAALKISWWCKHLLLPPSGENVFHCWNSFLCFLMFSVHCNH